MTTLREIIEMTPALAGLSYQEIADWLNECQLAANPLPQQKTSRAITRATITALIQPAEAWAIYSTAGSLKDDLFAAIDSGNRDWLVYLLGVAQASGKLSAGTLAKLQAELAATEPDPTWTPQVQGPPRWQTLGLAGLVTAADVQAALHEAV